MAPRPEDRARIAQAVGGPFECAVDVDERVAGRDAQLEVSFGGSVAFDPCRLRPGLPHIGPAAGGAPTRFAAAVDGSLRRTRHSPATVVRPWTLGLVVRTIRVRRRAKEIVRPGRRR